MQVKRIVSGGLAAAVVMSVFEFGFEPLLAPATERFFSRLGLPMPGETAVVALIATIVVLGLISVCLYSALADTVGHGVGTSAQTGIVVWTLSCLLPTITFYFYGIVDTRFFWLATALPLVQTVAGTVVGGLVYDGGKRARVPVIPRA